MNDDEENLQREHIIPRGLTGSWTLLKASCRKCSQITRVFERNSLENVYGSSRSAYHLRTKRPLPDAFPLIIKSNGVDTDISLPIDKYGSVLCLLGYGLPAYIDKRKYSKGIDIKESYLIRSKGSELNDLAEELKTKSFSFKTSFVGQSFERMIAKIAYGFTVFQYGLDKISKSYVTPAILGEVDDIGMWLGSISPTIGKEDIELKLIEKNKEVVAEIRLFGKLQVPTYIVVVGKLT